MILTEEFKSRPCANPECGVVFDPAERTDIPAVAKIMLYCSTKCKKKASYLRKRASILPRMQIYSKSYYELHREDLIEAGRQRREKKKASPAMAAAATMEEGTPATRTHQA